MKKMILLCSSFLPSSYAIFQSSLASRLFDIYIKVRQIDGAATSIYGVFCQGVENQYPSQKTRRKYK